MPRTEPDGEPPWAKPTYKEPPLDDTPYPRWPLNDEPEHPE